MTKLLIGAGGAGLAVLGAVLALSLNGAPASATSTLGGTTTATTATTATTPTTRTATTATTTRGRARREPGEDVRGRCDEAEHRNDPRCTGGATVEERHDRRGRGRGRGRGGDDRRGSNSGPG